MPFVFFCIACFFRGLDSVDIYYFRVILRRFQRSSPLAGLPKDPDFQVERFFASLRMTQRKLVKINENQ